MQKKAKKALAQKQRGSWLGVNPTTRVIRSKKREKIFELDIPDEFVGNWVLEDHSCEGMAGAWVVSSNWLNARLNESAVTLRVFVREIYRPDFRWFYLTGAAEELLNLTDEEAASLHLAKRLSNDGILCSELFEETRLNANCA